MLISSLFIDIYGIQWDDHPLLEFQSLLSLSQSRKSMWILRVQLNWTKNNLK